MFGSDGLVTDGSTMAGPGFKRNVNSLSTENQIRPPAKWGMVAVVVVPCAPSLIAKLSDSLVPICGGLVG